MATEKVTEPSTENPPSGDASVESDKTQSPDQPATTSAATPSTPETKTYTSEEVDQVVNDRIAKARADEKSKLYSKVEASDAKAKAAETEAEELRGKQSTIQQELDDIRSGKATELDSVTREIGELRDQNKKLSATIENVVDSAAQKIVESELRSYRKEKISSAGITDLGDLVNGASEAEIDASIESVKKREEAIAARAREDARRELGNNVPTPLAPGGTLPPETAITPANRANIAKLPRAEYAVKRAELLAEAKQKAGLA